MYRRLFDHITYLVTNLRTEFFVDLVMRINEQCPGGVIRRSRHRVVLGVEIFQPSFQEDPLFITS